VIFFAWRKTWKSLLRLSVWVQSKTPGRISTRAVVFLQKTRVFTKKLGSAVWTPFCFKISRLNSKFFQTALFYTKICSGRFSVQAELGKMKKTVFFGGKFRMSSGWWRVARGGSEAKAPPLAARPLFMRSYQRYTTAQNHSTCQLRLTLYKLTGQLASLDYTSPTLMHPQPPNSDPWSPTSGAPEH